MMTILFEPYSNMKGCLDRLFKVSKQNKVRIEILRMSDISAVIHIRGSEEGIKTMNIEFASLNRRPLHNV
ncbi:MAG TPA: hypothetical protein PKD00_00760 [Burkholderiales bacterium]|nr:hypothetical protein [Burkholderiales bacterium]